MHAFTVYVCLQAAIRIDSTLNTPACPWPPPLCNPPSHLLLPYAAKHFTSCTVPVLIFQHWLHAFGGEGKVTVMWGVAWIKETLSQWIQGQEKEAWHEAWVKLTLTVR